MGTGNGFTVDAPADVWARGLTAVLPHCSTDATLPMLAAVQVEVTPEGVLLVATDRYTLIVYRLDGAEMEGMGTVLLASADVKRIAQSVKGVKPPQLPVRLETAGDDWVTVTVPGGSSRCQGMGAQFPAWRLLLGPAFRNLEEGERRTEMAFNPSLLAKWAKACGKHEVLQVRYPAGDGGAVIVGDSFVGLQMRIRVDEFTVPAWAEAVVKPAGQNVGEVAA